VQIEFNKSVSISSIITNSGICNTDSVALYELGNQDARISTLDINVTVFCLEPFCRCMLLFLILNQGGRVYLLVCEVH